MRDASGKTRADGSGLDYRESSKVLQRRSTTISLDRPMSSDETLGRIVSTPGLASPHAPWASVSIRKGVAALSKRRAAQESEDVHEADLLSS